MVLVDTNMEKTPAAIHLDPDTAKAVFSQINYKEVVGLSNEHFTVDDMAQFVLDEANPAASAAEEAEEEHILASAEVLGRKEQLATHALGNAPLVVIMGDTPRDMKRIANGATEQGLGTPEQRMVFHEFAERVERVWKDLAKQQVALSNNARFVEAKTSGHHPHRSEPDLVAQEILSVQEQVGGIRDRVS